MENKQQLIEEAEASRRRMHALIDQDYDALIRCIETGEPIEAQPMSLRTDPRQFRATKPTEIIFGDGTVIEVNTWREAAKVLLNDCNRKLHTQLVGICDKVSGRDRKILSSDPTGMNVPLRIDEGIFFEGKFSTESLLYVLKELIFDAVGYDYSDIRIRLR